MARIFSSLEALNNGATINETRSSHKVWRDKTKRGITVDTCFCVDTQLYETGVMRGGVWYILEEYDTEVEAETKHKKWLAEVTAKPDMELWDIHEADLRWS
jgi:hypothetical protein